MEDCSCGCLARMVPMEDACIYQDGLQLTQVQRRGQLASLLYSRRGFRAPYVCHLKAADLEESWVCGCSWFVCFILKPFTKSIFSLAVLV